MDIRDIDNLPANAKKLQDLKQLYHKQHTGNTVPKTVPKSTVITPAATATQSTPGPQSHSVPDTLASTINISKSNPSSSNNPPPPPPPPRKQTPIPSPSSSRDSSPGEMPSIHDRAVFSPQATFDGKDKSKTRTHLQSFEDFVARQRLDTTNEFNEIKEYFLMTLCDLARQWFSSTTFTSYEDMKTKFTQEFSEYGKTAREWLKAWTELCFHLDVDNLDEYGQKFKELATLLAYPDDHQVQIFKMMMPENIELRIKDMNTLNECIDEAKACIAICQPSSLTSRMSTLTLAQSDNIPSTPPHSRSPSPKRNFRSENSDNLRGRPRQRPPILRKQFQGFWQYPGNFRPHSFSNGQNTFRTNSRFRSFSRSRSRPRSFNTSQQIQCYYCHHLGHTANNCFLRNRQISGSRQSYRGQRPFYNINN